MIGGDLGHQAPEVILGRDIPGVRDGIADLDLRRKIEGGIEDETLIMEVIIDGIDGVITGIGEIIIERTGDITEAGTYMKTIE